MKQTLALFFFLLAFTAFSQDNAYNLIPFPAQFSGQNGQFTLSASTKIVTTPKDAAQASAAQLLANYLKTSTGLAVVVSPAAPALAKGKHIFFQVHKAKRVGPEGYTLSIKPDRVTVEAETPKGYFYAVQSLMQLMGGGKGEEGEKGEEGGKGREGKSLSSPSSPSPFFPACQILDRPRYAYRGLMLDVSRHFMPVSLVKKTIDLLAMHKMNTLHWHLTDDQGWRIEIKKYPKLTQIGSKRAETLVGHYAQNFPQQFDGTPHGGFYTQDEIRDVVRYASARHVTIVPEIEMPGHALAALAAYPELSCDASKKYAVGTTWGVYDDVFCPNEVTFTFLQDVLTEVFALFPGKYVHIGGDECPKTAWKQSAFCQDLIKKLKLKNEDELQSYIIRRIDKFVTSKGRSIIGWDEILEGGLAPNAAVMSWRGTQGGIEAAKQKHNVVMTPGAFCYLDHYQANSATEPLSIGGWLPIEKVYGYEPTPAELTPDQQKYILGVQGNLWTEYITTPEAVEYMFWPRAVALAEIGWMPKGPRNFEDFAMRLKAHLPRLDAMNVNYAKRLLDIRAETQFTDVDGAASRDAAPRQLQVRLSKLDSDSKIFYTLNGKEATPTSTEYLTPITLAKTTTVKAVTVPGGVAFSETFFIHRAKGKPYTYTEKPRSDADSKKLTDGQVAQAPQSEQEWVELSGKDIDLTIDLGEVKPVTKVSANFLKKVLFGYFPPTSVEVALSKDGKDFKDTIAQPVTYAIEGPWAIVPVVADFKTSRARYVRVRAKNAGPMPAALGFRPNKVTTLAIDEVIVE
jgi:hexosaminidase